MDSTIVVAMIGCAGAFGSAYLTYRASTSVNRAAKDTAAVKAVVAESDAYTRSVDFYEKLLREADIHADRLRTQVRLLGEELDRATRQLTDEQATADGLRRQVAAQRDLIDKLQGRLLEIEAVVRTLRCQLTAAGVTLDESEEIADLNP